MMKYFENIWAGLGGLWLKFNLGTVVVFKVCAIYVLVEQTHTHTHAHNIFTLLRIVLSDVISKFKSRYIIALQMYILYTL